MYGRRSAGKRIRMDESGQEGQYDQYGQQNYYAQQQDYGEPQDNSYDPVAFYQQQRSEMLMESSQHVQASQEEIQRAQLEAQQRERMHQEPSQEMGRRSRSAAAAAKAALSMMSEDIGERQAPTSGSPEPPSPTRSKGIGAFFHSN